MSRLFLLALGPLAALQIAGCATAPAQGGNVAQGAAPDTATAANVRQARRFIEHMASRDTAAAFALLCDTASIWIAGRGTLTRAEARSLYDGATTLFVEGPDFEIFGVTAAGDRVALEVNGRALLANGRLYQNTYHWLFVFRDGKIEQLREYNDTAAGAVAFEGLGGR